VQEVGAEPGTGGGLYGTTPLFLERLGLTGLDELPDLAPLVPESSSVLDEHPDT
jgi:segregation and condensation protein B